ncbi:Zn-ribbon domain-containing OB-fold protein [Microbacterium sp. A93]|uniref:Zn-ribbon domain-containing OB-fold protein n=1 Tax=Microbacterium sp. A93 TaxID=3450716 RepID=UPI003F442AC5
MSTHESPQRPIPSEIEPHYAQYFEGLAEGRLTAPQCRGCERWQWPPRPMCGDCHGVDFDWSELPGQAEMFSFTTIERAFHPWFAERIPYTVAIGDFGNGVRIMGLLQDSGDGPEPACGQALAPVFTPAGDITVLEWRQAHDTQ